MVPWALRIRIRYGTVIDAVVFAVFNMEFIQRKRCRQYLLYSIARRQHLRSAGCHQLFVPRHRRSMFGRRACSVAGLQLVTRLPAISVTRSADSFRRDLKTLLFSFCQRTQRVRGFAIMCYINTRFRLALALTNTHRERDRYHAT